MKEYIRTLVQGLYMYVYIYISGPKVSVISRPTALNQ